MTGSELMALVAPLHGIEMVANEDGDYTITVHDFEGFDEEWNEIIVDTDAGRLNAILEGVPSEGGYYVVYHLVDANVLVQYDSMDI